MAKIMSGMVKAVDVADEAVRGLLKGVGMEAFFIGMHNAFVHGDAIEKAGYEFTDEQLSEMFVHFEALNALAHKIEDGE